MGPASFVLSDPDGNQIVDTPHRKNPFRRHARSACRLSDLLSKEAVWLPIVQRKLSAGLDGSQVSEVGLPG
jgi:hypothetical protein